ncbi:MAG: TIGR03084 family metal-binding protein [Acidimicrobiia bacterium]|nr:TIGR03084 family metal-binding protein [Acidimicrobiia bacterium]
MQQICDDLAAEHAALDALVANLTEEQWSTATPAAGWDVKATIVHLVEADLAALLAVDDAEGFERAKADAASGKGLRAFTGPARERSGAEVLEWWRDSRARMLEAFRARGPKDRIPWFGPSMSALSFATARLMETWSHGSDVASTFGTTLPATDRLRHVCHIGVTTRGWSYVNRGQEVPAGDVRVELVAPSGAVWTWGPEDAEAIVSGTAEDFALVVTQRRKLADTALRWDGELALDWMTKAQAFAGPATDTDDDRAGLGAGS